MADTGETTPPPAQPTDAQASSQSSLADAATDSETDLAAATPPLPGGDLEQTRASLAKKTEELEKLRETYEGKAKKTRSLLLAANKSITELRASAAKKDGEIERLTADLETARQRTAECELQMKQLEPQAARLQGDMQTLERNAARQIGELTTELERQRAAMSATQADFGAYRQKAASILREQMQTAEQEAKQAYESQIAALTAQQRALEDQVREEQHRAQLLTTEAEQLRKQLEVCERNLSEIQVMLQQTNARFEATIASHTQETQALRDMVDSQRAAHRAEQEKQAQSLSSLQDQKTQELDTKDKEISALQEQLKGLQLKVEQQETEKLSAKPPVPTRRRPSLSIAVDSTHNGTPVSSPLPPSPSSYAQTSFSRLVQGMGLSMNAIDSASQPPPSSSSPPSIPASSPTASVFPGAGLLAHITGAGGGSSPALPTYDAIGVSARERDLQVQIKMLQNLLSDSEMAAARLQEQEQILKQELRKMESDRNLEKSLNVQYLKNIMLKFAATADREPLMPVLCTLLNLSPEEDRLIRNGLL
ncbi:hypothetical protein RI367_007434 [Sorochytrium milnesiophthora]